MLRGWTQSPAILCSKLNDAAKRPLVPCQKSRPVRCTLLYQRTEPCRPVLNDIYSSCRNMHAHLSKEVVGLRSIFLNRFPGLNSFHGLGTRADPVNTREVVSSDNKRFSWTYGRIKFRTSALGGMYAPLYLSTSAGLSSCVLSYRDLAVAG